MNANFQKKVIHRPKFAVFGRYFALFFAFYTISTDKTTQKNRRFFARFYRCLIFPKFPLLSLSLLRGFCKQITYPYTLPHRVRP